MTDPIDRTGLAPRFWERKPLKRLNQQEWEALCDGCGKCCLNKYEDEDTGAMHYTNVACRLLDHLSCRCTDYAARAKRVAECLVLSADTPDAFHWLPASCAYRRLADGKDLPDWHPLITGDPESVHRAGISMRAVMVSERDTDEWTVLQKLTEDQEGDEP